ncbi:hypothetical protein KW805_04550 [Candidatus Pacearchaeota archaeon]|nr:hypothetical protein [Candidatus Pacearchaeota archaeon]
MRDEILAGLKNAMERGSSVDDAVNSFINAGYNAMEVREAAKALTGDTTSTIISPQEPVTQKSKYPLPPSQSIPPPVISRPLQSQPRKKNMVLIVFLLLILFILVGAIIFVLVKGDAITEYLSSLSS